VQHRRFSHPAKGAVHWLHVDEKIVNVTINLWPPIGGQSVSQEN